MSDTSASKEKKGNKSMLRSLIRIGVLILLIPLFLSFMLQIPFVQKMAINYLTQRIEKKIDRNIEIERIYLNPFKGLEMKSTLVEGDTPQDTLFAIDKLTISLAQNLFSLFDNRLGLKQIEIEGTKFHLIREKGQTKNSLTLLLEKLSSPEKEKSDKEALSLGVQEIILKDTEYYLQDKNSNSTVRYVLDEAIIIFNELNLSRGLLDLESFEALNPYVEIIKRGEGLKDSLSITTENIDNIKPIKKLDSIENTTLLSIAHFDIINGTFIYRDETQAPSSRYVNSIDFKNFKLDEVAFSADSFTYDASWLINADLKTISFRDDKGFKLVNLSSDDLVLSDKEVSLPNMVLETDNSKILSDLSFQFNSLSDFNDFGKKVYLRSEIKSADIAFSDLIHFIADLNKNDFFTYNKNRKLGLSGSYRGVLDNLTGRNVTISSGQSFVLSGNFGTINFTDTENALVNLKVSKLNTSIGFLRDFIPGFKPPQNFYKLGNIAFEGRFDGYFKDFVAVGQLESDLGMANLDMNLDVKGGNEEAKYSGEMNLVNFDLGYWSENEKLQKVTLSAKVKDGVGLTLNSVIADLEANVESLVYNNYAYRNFEMDGKIRENDFTGFFNIVDENINLNFDGDISYKDSILQLNVDAEIKELKLKELNFTDNYRDIAGFLKANISGSSFADLIGEIYASNVSIQTDTFFHKIDTLAIYAFNVPGGKSKLDVFSDFGVAKLEGTYNLADVIPQIKSSLKKNYPYHTRNWKIEEKTYADNVFVLNVRIDDTKNILQLAGIQDLKIKNLRAKGNVDSKRNSFNLDTDLDYFEYKGNKLYNTDLIIGNRNEIGFLVLNVDSSFVGGRKLNPVFLETDFRKDSLFFEVSTEEVFDSLQLVDVRGSLTPHEKGYVLNIKDNDWNMLGEKWTFYSGNEVIIGHNYLDIRDLIITDGYREIEIQDIDKKGIYANLKRFDFLIINGLIDYDKIDFSGEADVKVRVENLLEGDTYIQGNVYIDDFRLNQERYGILDLNFDLGADNSYKALISIAKGEQTVKANFVYDSQEDRVSGSVRGRSFPLDIFEYIITSGISETTGTADVDAEISGPPDDLKINGTGSFNKGGVKIDYLGTSFFFDDQKITITDNFLDLTGGVITDIEGNPGTMTGGLRHNLFRDFRLDLVMRSPEAVIMNTTKADNPLYFGFGKGQVEVAFSGSFDQTNMKINATTGPGTELNIPVEYTETGYDESFIKFVNKEELLSPRIIDEDSEFKIEGLDVEMELNMTDDADVKIIFNERLGDIIQGRGRGFLQIYARRSGEFEIFGDYEVEQGEYLFTAWGVVAKPFVVQKGGRIKWTGDPINAALDIKAEYQVRAPLTIFLDEFLQTADNDVQVEARTKQDIDLNLLLGGTLYNPLVKFDIDFPSLTGELNNYAESKLRSLRTNEIALNSQVLGLIVFNSFLPTVNNSDLNFSNEAVVTAANTLSEFVSSQLSLYLTGLLQEALSENGLIADIDFEIGLRKNSTIYNPEETTDLYPDEIEVHLNNRFRFLDERLSLGAGFNYVADSPYGISNYYIPDFVIEYFLTNDRQLKLRMYGRYDYDQVEIARRQRYGLGIGYRKEFGSLTDFIGDLKKTAKSSKDSGGQ